MMNALIIEEQDNVAVAIEPVRKGEVVSFQRRDGSVETLTAAEEIEVYHKFAVRMIREGEKITKYGEHIGEAACEIKPGEHVHTHNVISVRENLEA